MGEDFCELIYLYDGNGNRTAQTDQNNITTTLAYDQANRMISYSPRATDLDNGDGLRMSKPVSGRSETFTWDTAESLPLLLQDGNTSYITGPGGLPLEEVNGSSVLWIHADQLGSTRALPTRLVASKALTRSTRTAIRPIILDLLPHSSSMPASISTQRAASTTSGPGITTRAADSSFHGIP